MSASHETVKPTPAADQQAGPSAPEAPKARRVEAGGLLIDRSKPTPFTFNGEQHQGFEGDTLASALIANDRRFVGRSFKYHRPRGFVAAGVEEPNGLFGVGEGGRFEPNQRGTTTELYEGLVARSQNHFPSLNFDLGAANAKLSRFFPAGFYYKTFMWPRAAWKHVFEPIVRQAAGLGKAPTQPDADAYEHFHFYCDVLIVGAGVAGIMAAKAAAASGARVLLVEQAAHFGGRAVADGEMIDGQPAHDWAREQIALLERKGNVTVRRRMQASAFEDHGYLLCYERVTDHLSDAERPDGAPRHRLWRVRTDRVVLASGAIERTMLFSHNDLPGVMLASAMRDYLALYGVACAERTVVYTNNDDAYRTALALQDAGAEVAAVVDSRSSGAGSMAEAARERGIRVINGAAILKASGKRGVETVEIALLDESGRPGLTERISCDGIAMSGGWSPVVHLWSHAGGKNVWDEAALCFRPDLKRGPISWDGAATATVVGAANAAFDCASAAAEGLAAGTAIARDLGREAAGVAAPAIDAIEMAPTEAMWFAPAGKAKAKTAETFGAKQFVDFQNDVTAADIRLAAREGYESVEHAKRYTTLGMATDQGKLSNIPGHAVLAQALGKPIPAVGTTTFRPPYTPISLASIAGREQKELFKPVRETPMHGWHAAHGAVWEPVGDWRRPYCYPRAKGDAARETHREAVNREIIATRRGVGLLDASTLGKIIVQGPDAGAFLDLLYTNMMSTLKPGRCRYGLMCDDNGYLFDDGVVVRLDDGGQETGGEAEQTFLCHTTSGGAERVHGWMEEWLQTEWPDLRVFTQNVTEAYAQIAVAGPKSRAVIESLGFDGDLSAEALPFMAWTDGVLAGMPVRIFRISFSGELSYELATPASFGLPLWDALLKAGQAHKVTTYGTEALHVMRAEKGFIMIGDETDGTVTPLDLDLGWAVSKKKTDFIGRRAMKRPFLTDPGRKRLVGLLTENPTDVLPDGAHIVEAMGRDGTGKTIGHVTSSYWSPTLRRSIAMALVRRGPERMGQLLDVSTGPRTIMRAKVVNPVFYDPENARQAM